MVSSLGCLMPYRLFPLVSPPLRVPFCPSQNIRGENFRRGARGPTFSPPNRGPRFGQAPGSQEVEYQTFSMFPTNSKTSPNDPKRSKTLLDTKKAEITSRRDYLVKHRPTSGTPFRQKIPGGKTIGERLGAQLFGLDVRGENFRRGKTFWERQ